MVDKLASRAITEIWQSLFAVALVAAMLWQPLQGFAQEATPPPSGITSQSDGNLPEPTQVPAPTAPPPTMVPPPPEPTALPTMQVVPTQAPPTPTQVPIDSNAPSPTVTLASEVGQTPLSSGQTPTATPSPTQTTLNTDSLTSISGSGPFSLGQAATQTLTYTYVVTTGRTATSLHAELRHADGSLATAWWLQGQAGTSPWSSNGAVIDVTESAALTQDTSFAVTLIVTAPAQVTEQYSVFLYVRSTASTERGDVEAGVADESAGASFTAVATDTTETEPAAAPTPTPSADPTGEAAVVEDRTRHCGQTAPSVADAIDIDEFASFSTSGGPLDFGTSSWNGTDYAAVTGSLALTISGTPAGKCSSKAGTWSIQISTDGLYKEDTNEQIPANAITYLGSQSTLDVPEGLIPVGADIPLAPGVTTTIASGDGSIGGRVTWNPIFQLDPPNTAPAGAYSGTIRIEVVNAP